ASISYTPKDGAITRYFETGGFFDTDINGSPYYYYNAHEISGGDILTVNYNDGRGTVLYMLTYEGDARYVSTTDRNDIIPGDSVSFFNEQRNKPFTLGEDNCIYAEYMGKRAPVKVKIVANPISVVVYTPANEITVTEYTDGEWVTEGDDTYYRYNTPWFKHGDRLEVTYTESGETVVYTYYTSYNGEPLYNLTGFYDEEQIQMPNEDTLFTSHRGKWVTGGDNYMSVYYMDNESNSVRVNIVENPVKAIRFERKNDTVLTENVDTYFDDYDQRSYYSIPHHRDGDRLTVIDKYGAEKVYEYNGFDAYICEGEENISAEEVHFRNDQHENPWGVGEHQYAVEYSGCEYLLTATVVENTVTRIEYIPKNAFNVIENTHGGYDAAYGYYRYWYQWSGDGDKLVVYDKNTGRTEYEYKIIDEDNWESAFVSESGDTISPEKISFEDDQYKNPWTVGNENYYYAVYMGARYPLVATIRDNPIKAIRYIPVKTPEVMTRYQSYYDEELGYEIYNPPRFNEGDKLIVTDKNSIDKTYVAERKYYSDIVFVSDDGDEISEYDIDRESNQHITPWHLGDGNEYFVEYLGVTSTVNCTVVDNPVASIEYIPANPISFY
ncbi:MAG: hypothetical protein J6T73_00170, partial [Clostridia bacterium]|nr:hypothetical protein [Clostridia bacterium]